MSGNVCDTQETMLYLTSYKMIVDGYKFHPRMKNRVCTKVCSTDVVTVGLFLLSSAKIPLSYWPFAFATAVFLITRLPTPVLSNTSPFQKLFNSTPNYQKLRTFGCLCFPWLRPYAPNKLENRSLPCVFIGYSLTQSAYQCLDPLTGRIYVSRHVRFNETQFPFPTMTKQTIPNPPDPTPIYDSTPVTIIPCTSPLIQSSPTAASNQPLCPGPLPAMQQPPPVTTAQPEQANVQNVQPAIVEMETTQPAVASSTRAPAETSTQGTAAVASETQAVVTENRHSMTTHSRNNIVKPVAKYNLSATLECDPYWIQSTWQQAMKHKHWRDAMSREFTSTNENRTWDLEEASQHMNVVGCRWVFTIKYNPDGSIDIYKARIVAKSYHQQQGIDYGDTFCPVIKSTTIRIVLGLAVNHDWPVRQIDVNTAFLQGHLQEEVFMSQPPGFTDLDRPHHVCKLRNALYGLKQAPRAWYSELKTFLIRSGFKNSLALIPYR